MLEYLLLATFVVVLSATTVWFIRALESFGEACYQRFLPSSKGNLIKNKPVIHSLSEKIENLPMPWGWCAAKQQLKPGVPAAPARLHVTIPWGWPGNLFQDHRHNLLTVVPSERKDENRTAEVLQFPVHRGKEDLSAKDLCLEIRGS